MPSPLEGFRRPKPGKFLSTALKIPSHIYFGPLAALMSWRCVMVLTTTGRKSGQPRTLCISYMPLNDHYVSFSGWGVSSNWYRNVVANPEVTIRVGGKTMRATGHLILEPKERIDLMMLKQEQSKHCGPPMFMRPILRLTKAFDFDAEIAMAVEHAHELPIVEFEPHK